MGLVTREQMITQSVQDYARDKLFNEIGYSQADIEISDAFPYDRFQSGTPEINYIAVAFAFDDGGTPGELGSTFKRRLHTIRFFTFGKDQTFAQNIASALKHVLEEEGRIPLLNIGVDSSIIDYLLVNDNKGITSQQITPRDPRPWEKFAWMTQVQIYDEYYSGHDS